MKEKQEERDAEERNEDSACNFLNQPSTSSSSPLLMAAGATSSDASLPESQHGIIQHNNNSQSSHDPPTELKIDESRGKIYFRPYRGVQFLDTDDEEHSTNNNDGVNCSIASPDLAYSFYPRISSCPTSRRASDDIDINPRSSLSKESTSYQLPHSSRPCSSRYDRGDSWNRFVHRSYTQYSDFDRADYDAPMSMHNIPTFKRNMAPEPSREYGQSSSVGNTPSKKEARRSLSQYWRQNVLPNVREFCRGHSPSCSTNSAPFQSPLNEMPHTDGQELGACAMIPEDSSTRKKHSYGPKSHHHSSGYGGDSSSSSDSEQKHATQGSRKNKAGFLRRFKERNSAKKDKPGSSSVESPLPLTTERSNGSIFRSTMNGEADPWALPSTSNHTEISSEPMSYSFNLRHVNNSSFGGPSAPISSSLARCSDYCTPPRPDSYRVRRYRNFSDFHRFPSTEDNNSQMRLTRGIFRRRDANPPRPPSFSTSVRADIHGQSPMVDPLSVYYHLPVVPPPPTAPHWMEGNRPSASAASFSQVRPAAAHSRSSLPFVSTPSFFQQTPFSSENSPRGERPPRPSDTSDWLNHLLNSFPAMSEDNPPDPRMLWWRWLQINQLLESETDAPQGLSKEKLGLLPRWTYPGPPPTCHYRRTYKEGSATLEKECQICLCEYVDGDVICLLPCGHELHDSCVTTWLQQKSSCPVCRTPVEPR